MAHAAIKMSDFPGLGSEEDHPKDTQEKFEARKELMMAFDYKSERSTSELKAYSEKMREVMPLHIKPFGLKSPVDETADPDDPSKVIPQNCKKIPPNTRITGASPRMKKNEYFFPPYVSGKLPHLRTENPEEWLRYTYTLAKDAKFMEVIKSEIKLTGKPIESFILVQWFVAKDKFEWIPYTDLWPVDAATVQAPPLKAAKKTAAKQAAKATITVEPSRSQAAPEDSDEEEHASVSHKPKSKTSKATKRAEETVEKPAKKIKTKHDKDPAAPVAEAVPATTARAVNITEANIGEVIGTTYVLWKSFVSDFGVPRGKEDEFLTALVQLKQSLYADAGTTRSNS